jgi:monoamine oxidase
MAKISTKFGQSPDFFGREDYLENLKRGVSSQEMLDFVKANPNLMRGKLQEQVRDEMRQGALREAQEKTTREREAKEKADREAKEKSSTTKNETSKIGKNTEVDPGGAMDYLSDENIGKFQDLLNRLQRSKMEQSQQSARESRKGTFAQGIASMMSNF